VTHPPTTQPARASGPIKSEPRRLPARKRHPAVLAEQARLVSNVQLRIAVWMVFLESRPWPTLTLAVSLEAIFLSTFVMVGQNRQAAFQQAKADHDFNEQELELKTNTELTREIHRLTTELHRQVLPNQVGDLSGSGK
jgi:uncharacterized membrane protein